MGDLLLGLAVHARTLTPVAGRLAENLTALLVCIDGALDACHRIYSLCPSGVLRARLGVQRGSSPLLYIFGVRLRNSCRAASWPSRRRPAPPPRRHRGVGYGCSACARSGASCPPDGASPCLSR